MRESRRDFDRNPRQRARRRSQPQLPEQRLEQQIQIQLLALRERGIVLGLPGDGGQYRIDDTHTETRKGGLLVWVGVTYPAERTLTTGTGRQAGAKRVVVRDCVTCKKKRTGWLEQAAYDGAGSATFALTIPEDLLIIGAPIPGSLDEAALSAACRQQPAAPPDTNGRTRNPLTG